MTAGRTLIWWVLAGVVALAVLVAFTVRKSGAGSALPAASAHANLPALFEQKLQAARDQAVASGYAAGEVRKLAHLYQANRLNPEARICYQLIAAKAPGLEPQDHYYLADIARDEGNLEEAQKELRAVLTAAPGYLPARLALAEVLFKTGQDEVAGKEYAAILEREPNQPQAMFGLARIELQQGKDDAAVARLEDLMASHPESASGAALFAQVLDRRGEADRAVAMTEWSRQKPEPIPADPWMSALLEDCYDLQRLAFRFEDYAKTGQINEAVPFLRRIEELDPKSSLPPLLRGWSQAQAGHDLEAEQEYRLALTNGGDPEKICPYLVQSLLTLGKDSEAAKLMADFYAKMPDSIPILSSYSDVAVHQGDDKLSRLLLTRLLEKEPYLHTANMNLARILWASGERDEAAQCLRRVAATDAKDIPSRALLGEYYLDKADPLSAIKPLEEANARAAGQVEISRRLGSMLGAAYRQTGIARVKQGRYLDAVEYFDKSIPLAPADPVAYAAKAEACVQLGQFRRAAECLEKLAALQPANPTVYLSLGDVRYQDGDREQARREWQRALQLTTAGDSALRNALDARLSGHISEETFK